MTHSESRLPTATKQRVEPSAVTPPANEPAAEPDERRSIGQRVEPSAETPPTNKPVVQPGERLQEMFAQALLPDEFDAVARQALKEASQAMAQGNQELVKRKLRRALSSARKSENSRLLKDSSAVPSRRQERREVLADALTEMASPARTPADAARRKISCPEQSRAETGIKATHLLESTAPRSAGAKDLVRKQALAKEFLEKAQGNTKGLGGPLRSLGPCLRREPSRDRFPTALLAVDRHGPFLPNPQCGEKGPDAQDACIGVSCHGTSQTAFRQGVRIIGRLP